MKIELKTQRPAKKRRGITFIAVICSISFVSFSSVPSADVPGNVPGRGSAGGEGIPQSIPAPGPQTNLFSGQVSGWGPQQPWGAMNPQMGGGSGGMGCGGMTGMSGMMGMGGQPNAMGNMPLGTGGTTMNMDQPLTMREILYILSMQDAIQMIKDLVRLQQKALEGNSPKGKPALVKELKGIEERLAKLLSDYRVMLSGKIRNE